MVLAIARQQEKCPIMYETKKSKHFQTLCTHLGLSCKQAKNNNSNEAIISPITQSAVFNLGTSAEAEALFSGSHQGHAYTRFGNPTVDELGAALCDLEGGGGALVTSSGNSATLCAVSIAMAERRGKLVTHTDIYGGSHELLEVLSKSYGLDVEVVDSAGEAEWLAAVGRAEAVLLESPSNPLMRLIDIRATAKSAHENGATVIVDNTVATPYNQRPMELGADWVVQSTSKYLNGHSDLIGGCLIKREALTVKERTIHKTLGGTVNALEAWLILRGLRSFALRMKEHNRNGKVIAEWLDGHPAVSKVYYPGLGGGRQAEIFAGQMSGGSGLVAFDLAEGGAAADRFLDGLKLITHAVSLGGMESLAVRPSMSSHRGMSPESRKVAGIADGLIRLSVGTESTQDLIADLEQAIGGI